jgi:hypothetical protein
MALNAPVNPRDRAVRGRIGRKQPSRQQTRGWLFYRGHGKKVGMEERDMHYSPGKRFYVHESVAGSRSLVYVTYGKQGQPVMHPNGASFRSVREAVGYIQDEFRTDPVVLPPEILVRG